MTDIDRYVERACRRVSGPVALRRHLRKELKAHLEEAIKDLVAKGMSEAEATANVIEAFGEPEMIREGFQAVYGQSVTSLFVDQAMNWKERTMKSDWKWNFAAQTGLVLIIVLAVCTTFSIGFWVVPRAKHEYSVRGLEVLPALEAVIQLWNFMVKNWYLFVVVPIGGLGLFEWKCRSDNKALIRTTIGVGVSLVVMVNAFWWAGAMIVALALLLQK